MKTAPLGDVNFTTGFPNVLSKEGHVALLDFAEHSHKKCKFSDDCLGLSGSYDKEAPSKVTEP